MLVRSRSCGGGDEPGRLGATQQALSGAFVDPETPDTNVVVAVDLGCTGTLITPRIVLTANHCIYGAQVNNNCTAKTPGKIGIGAATLVDRKYVLPYVDAETMTNACQVSGEQANDLGVIYMATPVTQSAFQKDPTNAIIPRVVRPSLLGPPDTGFASDGGSFRVQGFSTASGQLSRRSLQLSSSPSFSFPFAGGNDTWYVTPSGWDTESGDSGGPLYYAHPNGRIDVLGALTGHSNSEIVWPAVTSGANRAWLLAHVLESNVPVALRHTAPWLSRHGQTSNTWWGELDYSGPCDLAVDRDCDGWWDHGVAASLVHDNCPYVANQDQVDKNEDGIGDLCALCPFDPAGSSDTDLDGVCGGSASVPLFKRDNCPLVTNASQLNCNEEAELVKQRQDATFEILGDACDPVPCPSTTPVATGEYRVGGGHPQFGGFFSGRVTSDGIDAVRVAPHVRAPAGTTPIARALPDVVTYARFCQQNLPLFDCHADASIRNSALTDFPSSSAETALATKPWHRVQLSINANRDSGWNWPYNDSVAARHTWSFASDSAFWTSGGRIPQPAAAYAATCSNTALVGGGTCLDGALWYHAASTVGRSTNPNANGFFVGVHDADITNHYFDIRPDRAYAKTYSGTGLMRKFFFLVHTLPDPAPYETVLRSRIRPIVAAATELDAPRVLEDHGGSWDAAPLVSPTMAANFAFPGVVWASALEPAGVAANLDDRVQAMGVTANGTTVYDTVLFDRGTLKSAAELGYPSASSPADAPAPRSGFLTVLSRQAGGVFVIGGLDAGTNLELADVHLWRPYVGWSTIVPSVAFAKAKTATFSPADGQLWILEQRTRSYTLLRMSPWTRVTQVLGTWTRGTIWDQHFLAVDRDGQVLRVAASKGNVQSKFARLRVNTSGAAYASQIDADSIPYTTTGPIVDKDEYGVIVRDTTGAVTSVYRRANLLGGTGTFTLDAFFL